MDYLPLFLDVRDRKCVVVGGGEVAFRKAALLIRAGAKLHIVSPRLSKDFEQLLSESGGHHSVAGQQFSDDQLDGATLVIAATDSLETNSAVSSAAATKNIPVNVVDQPELCSFIMPSIVDRSPVLIAISTGGASPILARKLKELNESLIPGNVDRLAKLLAGYRPRAREVITDFKQRTRFWEDILDSAIPELVYAGKEEEARLMLEQNLSSAMGNSGASVSGLGEVYLVGAGPGDPDLLTLRALRLMHKADVVLYDRLVSEAIMQKIRPDAKLIYVGKQRASHAAEQESINLMLVRLAQEGNKVLRLKGGDPFIFGRGGEELETLASAGIPFQIVPGVTAASGCSTYAGIPLTHRDYAQSVQFLTGHLKDGSLDLDWSSLAREQHTLVFYMGLHGLPVICSKLIEHGLRHNLPVAVVQQGTTGTQRVVTATLADIAELVSRSEIKAPTIIIVGEVVSLRDKLSWFETGDP